MLKVSLVELFFRGFPETLLFLWAINLINMKKLTIKRWILLSSILTVVIYLIRMLPIQYGVNTLIAVVILIISEYLVNKLPLEKAIASSLIVITLLSICEFINFMLLRYLFNINTSKLMNEPLPKILLGIPSLVFFAAFVFVFYTFNKKKIMKGKIKNVLD